MVNLWISVFESVSRFWMGTLMRFSRLNEGVGMAFAPSLETWITNLDKRGDAQFRL